MSDESGGRGGVNAGVASRVVVEAGRLVQVCLLAWSVLVGYLLVVGVTDWVVDSGMVEPGGPAFVAVFAGVFAAPFLVWAGIRRTRGRPLSPPTPTTDDRLRARALFARRGSLHPVTLAILLLRALVSVTVLSLVVAAPTLAVDGDARAATAALTAAATALALWVVVERTAVEWMLAGVDGGFPLRTVAVDVTLRARETVPSLWAGVEWTRSAADGGSPDSTVDDDAMGVHKRLASALEAQAHFGREAAVRGRRAAVWGRGVAGAIVERTPDRRERRDRG